MEKLLSPSTGESIPSVPYTPEESIPKIFEQARKAQGQWAELSYRERSVYIYRIRDFVKQNAERIASLVSQCNGKTRVDAFATEVVPAILSCTWYAKNTSKVLAREKISPGHFLFLNKGYYVDHEPLGIVGIISPWNYPFSIPFGEVIMGLMAGNAIVLKVGTPVVPIGALIEECIAAARLPTGLFTHVNISGAKVSQLFLSNKINKIFFTGSVNVGKQLMKEAADTLTPLSLELGGKDPMIICEDADLERAVNCVCWGGFQNAGQSCGGVERIYVHRSRFDDFVKMLCNKTECLRHGPSDTTFDVDIGAMTTSSQLKIVQNQVADAVKRGARIAAQSRAVGDCSQGYFYPATVLLDVTSDMTIMKEETFGPVLPVMMFDTVEEALRLANDNCMALTAGVFSCNMKNAQKIASALHAGVVTINDHLYTHGMAETPWGGWKDSGLGRTHGSHGLKEMCNAKCVSYERIPCFLIPRNLWWYPFDFATYNCLRSLVGVLAPSSLGDFFFSLAKALPCAAEKMFTPWTNSKFSTNTVSNRTFFATFSIVIVVSMVSTVKFIAALITSSTKVQNA